MSKLGFPFGAFDGGGGGIALILSLRSTLIFWSEKNQKRPKMAGLLFFATSACAMSSWFLFSILIEQPECLLKIRKGTGYLDFG